MRWNCALKLSRTIGLVLLYMTSNMKIWLNVEYISVTIREISRLQFFRNVVV